jgi:pimeloyl-ACP methyl ester carboxylesterase/DNA-binding CsgD family transcriptional regulator
MRRTVTRYALSGSTRIAYQVIGQGPRDLVLAPAFPCNLEILPEDPGYSRLIRRLSRFCRLIVFDPRGTGLSDGLDPTAPADRETRVADLVAVMDAAGSGRAALLGAGDGAAQALLLAARQPARVRALVLYGGHAGPRSRSMPRADDPSADHWGRGALLAQIAPGRANDPDFAAWWGRLERFAASPSAARAQMRMIAATDASDLLAAISAPSLLLHRSEDLHVGIAGSRELCARLPSARLVELSGGDHPIWLGDVDILADHVEEFLTGTKAASFDTRVLAVTLATRVLGPSGSMGSAAAGRHMDERLALFRDAVPRLTARHGGAAGWPQDDRLDATFDSATRALACAVELREVAQGIGLALAQGIHVGEIDRAHATPSGPAVQIAARIAEATRNPEILLSRLASELVIGAGMQFVDRGTLPGQDGHPAPLALVALSAERHLEPLGRAGAKFADFELLSTRERQVVKLIAAGGTNPQIAVQLGLSEHTVKRHVANILLKLDLPSRAAAASLAARQIEG